jgi:hypothetical protein
MRDRFNDLTGRVGDPVDAEALSVGLMDLIHDLFLGEDDAELLAAHRGPEPATASEVAA